MKKETTSPKWEEEQFEEQLGWFFYGDIFFTDCFGNIVKLNIKEFKTTLSRYTSTLLKKQQAKHKEELKALRDEVVVEKECVCDCIANDSNSPAHTPECSYVDARKRIKDEKRQEVKEIINKYIK